MVKNGRWKVCARPGCVKKFRPKNRRHLYHTKSCKNRHNQAMLRERAKGYSELHAAEVGANG